MARERHLVLDNMGFFVRNAHYDFNDVETVWFHYVVEHTTFTSFDEHFVTIKLYLKGHPDPIKITSHGSPFRLRRITSGKKLSDALVAKFNELCSITFGDRLKKYTDGLRTSGYFMYDGKKFYENGDVVSTDWKISLTSDRPILKSPFVIFHEKRGAGLFGGKKR